MFKALLCQWEEKKEKDSEKYTRQLINESIKPKWWPWGE